MDDPAPSTDGPRRPGRLIIFDFVLSGFRGHFLNYNIGFREAARARGMAVSVYLPRDADPAVVALLDGRPLLPEAALSFPGDQLLEQLARATAAMRPAWLDVERTGVSGDDILLFAEASFAALLDLSRWLGTLPKGGRPAVFVRFMGGEVKDADTGPFNDSAGLHRLIASFLTYAPGGDRVFYTVNATRHLGDLVRLVSRRVFPMPMPKYYGPPRLGHAKPGSGAAASVYFHITLAEHDDLVRRVAEAILRQHPGISVVLKYAWAREGAPSPSERMTLLTGGQTPDEYLAAMASADIVVLPYEPAGYRVRNSGVFCEAAAFGKVVVAPAPTWMSGEIEAGRAAGTLFTTLAAEPLLAAVDAAVRRYAELAIAARDQAPGFRAENSCDRNLALMLEMAAGTHDMLVNCVPGLPLDFSEEIATAQYLVRGWSHVEEELGVWTDGPEAELCLRVGRDAHASALVITLVPFLAAGHTLLEVSVSVNGAPTADWVFSGDGWKSEERTIAIPAGFTGPELRVVLRIRDPASPHSLGMSPDERQLGILLQKVVVVGKAAGKQIDGAPRGPSRIPPV